MFKTIAVVAGRLALTETEDVGEADTERHERGDEPAERHKTPGDGRTTLDIQRSSEQGRHAKADQSRCEGAEGARQSRQGVAAIRTVPSRVQGAEESASGHGYGEEHGSTGAGCHDDGHIPSVRSCPRLARRAHLSTDGSVVFAIKTNGSACGPVLLPLRYRTLAFWISLLYSYKRMRSNNLTPNSYYSEWNFKNATDVHALAVLSLVALTLLLSGGALVWQRQRHPVATSPGTRA